jgi:hypothetical protein
MGYGIYSVACTEPPNISTLGLGGSFVIRSSLVDILDVENSSVLLSLRRTLSRLYKPEPRAVFRMYGKDGRRCCKPKRQAPYYQGRHISYRSTVSIRPGLKSTEPLQKAARGDLQSL